MNWLKTVEKPWTPVEQIPKLLFAEMLVLLYAQLFRKKYLKIWKFFIVLGQHYQPGCEIFFCKKIESKNRGVIFCDPLTS